MTMKQKILAILESQPEDTKIQKVIEDLCLFAAVEEGVEQLDRGKGILDENVDWDALLAGAEGQRSQ